MSKSLKLKYSFLIGKKKEQQEKIKFHRIHLTKAANESNAHILLKLIAFSWFIEKIPVIEPKIHWKYRPDVAIFSQQPLIQSNWFFPYQNDLRIEEWIECKRTSPKKILKIIRSLFCYVSLFHRISAINGYSQILGKILRISEKPLVSLYGIGGDLDNDVFFNLATHRIIITKNLDTISFFTKDEKFLCKFLVQQTSLVNDPNYSRRT